MSGVGKNGGSKRQRLVSKAHMRLVETPELPEANDPELLAWAAEGDERAVRALYKAHVGRVYRHVARVLGPDDPDIEDVVQRVFLAALDGADGFAGRSGLGSWLVGIASRRALDEARSRWRRGRWRRMTASVGFGRPATRPDESTSDADEAQQLLQVLNPDQRSVFVLKEVEGHTLQEISDMTGVGISTLHARLKAARKRLDAELRKNGEVSHG